MSSTPIIAPAPAPSAPRPNSTADSYVSSKRSVFRDSALLSGLVTEDQVLEAVAAIMQKAGTKATVTEIADRELAATMVSLGYLTSYQADQLLAGRTKLHLGPYIITDWIGQGGMGQVFKAVHEMLGRESAIKVLPLHKSTHESIENFRREIRAQAKLDHPNLVRAFDAGEDGNVHYLVVEYVPGTDLRRLVRSKGMLTVQQAAHIIMQAARGLEHAHSRGLIHRDIKPGNILVTNDGVTKVSDLGLAGHLNESDDRRGKIVGTADYLAPEQIRTPLDVTKVADIYSLGCTLYYGITGKVPFPGGNAKSKARRHLEETPWHPRRFNAEVSDEFVDLIGDMMEKNPRERIQSAAEVAERLAPWAADDSPIIDPTDSRARWTSRAPAVDGEQDTDPGMSDVAEMAMGELSGSGSELSQGSQGTLAVSDAGIETGRIPHPKSPQIVPPPPHPTSIVQQFEKAGRIPADELQFSLTWLVITNLVSIAAGALIGVILSQILGG